MKASTSLFLLIGLTCSMTIFCDDSQKNNSTVREDRDDRELHVSSFSIGPNEPYQFPSSHDSMVENQKNDNIFHTPQFDLHYLNPSVNSKLKSVPAETESDEEKQEEDNNSSNVSQDSQDIKESKEDVSEGRENKGKDDQSVYYYYYPATMTNNLKAQQSQSVADSGAEEDQPIASYSVSATPNNYPSPIPPPSPQYSYQAPPSTGGYFLPSSSPPPASTPAPQYGYPSPPAPAPAPSPRFEFSAPSPPQPQYGYPAPASNYGYGQGSANLPAITGGGFGGNPNGPGGPPLTGPGGPPLTGPGGPPLTGPPNGPPVKGSIDYILIPLILIGIAAPIFVVCYVVLGSFEAKLAPVVLRRSLSWMNSSLESIKPTTDALMSSVSRALDSNQCWERIACQAGSYCHQYGISDAGMNKHIESFVPRSYRRQYRAFMESMKNSTDCSIFTCP